MAVGCRRSFLPRQVHQEGGRGRLRMLGGEGLRQLAVGVAEVSSPRQSAKDNQTASIKVSRTSEPNTGGPTKHRAEQLKSGLRIKGTERQP